MTNLNPESAKEVVERLRERWEATDAPLVTKIDRLLKACREAATLIEAQAAEIAILKETRKALDHRIHCQRKSNRANWEIVESRRKWLGSQSAQRAWMLQRGLRLTAETALSASQEREKALREAILRIGAIISFDEFWPACGCFGDTAGLNDAMQAARALTQEGGE